MVQLLQRTASSLAASRSSRPAVFRQQTALRAPARSGARFCQAIAQGAENGVASKPAAAAAAKKKGAVRAFTNTLKFQVPAHSARAFEEEWQRRAADMKLYAGFQGFSLTNKDGVYIVSSSWNSIPEWEAYSLGPEIRRSHLPHGIYQYVPAKGEGFPEDFVPFVDFAKPVDAKY